MGKVTRFLEKVGWIPKVNTEVNQPCYDKYGRPIGWLSRSCATSIFVFCKNDDGDWCVLASERGMGCPDFRGHWNCPCGYIDFNETSKECAMRELYEETGILVEEELVKFVGYNDDPRDNRQNITFRFAAVYEDAKVGDFTFSKKLNEKDEVGEIRWVKITEIDDYLWAFGHDKIIIDCYNKVIGV